MLGDSKRHLADLGDRMNNLFQNLVLRGRVDLKEVNPAKECVFKISSTLRDIEDHIKVNGNGKG